MHRYQCPDCQRMHDRDLEPKCSSHGLGFSAKCGECVHLYEQKPCRRGDRP